MKRSTGYLGAGIIGAAVLGGSITAGYLEKTRNPPPATATFAQGVSDAQVAERRRGKAAAVAVAETAVK
ncbi:hypothetical protein ACQKJZ_13925 [Sphingomonas sp. NPDC019816]|uniref:hypothetical protein n=1 Tax=unclassified Sphingomonas TaxID=196159 RepID=UPI00289CAEF1|nr:hypothetical protein [Sphingomonas sp.]